MLIAVIEDARHKDDVIRRTLRSEGYETVRVADRKEGMGQELRALAPDVIIFRNPDDSRDPASFIQRLCGEAPSLFVKSKMLFTCGVPRKHYGQIFGVCNSSVISEPVRPDALLSKIHALLYLTEEQDDITPAQENARAFLEAQYLCATAHIENMARMISRSAPEGSVPSNCASEILTSLEEALYLAASLSHAPASELKQELNNSPMMRALANCRPDDADCA